MEKFGLDRQTGSVIVNYADDFVICCRRGGGASAAEAMKRLMAKIGLTVNERKTRLASVPEGSFDFLGYTIGRFHGKDGRPFIGTRPSKKAVSKLLGEIHEQTTSQWNASEPTVRTAAINQKLRGWAGYFDQGPVVKIYRTVRNYTERRLRRWLMRRRKQRGTGYRQYPDGYLYETLGLFKLHESRTDQTNAKAGKSEMRAGCGKSARPVRRAGTGNGTSGETQRTDGSDPSGPLRLWT